MKPTRSILDRSFPYTPSHKTDITRTWEIARKRLEEEKKKRQEIVRQLPRKDCRNG